MYPKPYLDYLVHFHGDRDYFECHEILEEFWKEVDSGNKSSVWVGLILFAVSAYHHRRENFPGALRTLQKAQSILKMNGHPLEKLGIHPERFLNQINMLINAIDDKKDYESVNIPIVDSKLLEICRLNCKKKGFLWQQRSNPKNYDIIHRHSERDRSEVIYAREQSLINKNKGSE